MVEEEGTRGHEKVGSRMEDILDQTLSPSLCPPRTRLAGRGCSSAHHSTPGLGCTPRSLVDSVVGDAVVAVVAAVVVSLPY